MKNLANIGRLTAALVFLMLVPAVAAGQIPTPTAGDAAFAAGNFDAASAAYAAGLASDPNDFDAELGIGTVELYRNHIDAARADLQRAVALDPKSPIARSRLSAIEKRTSGPSDYGVAFDGPEARIPLVTIDPLPTFKAKIDGVPVTLVIDTGGTNLDLSASTVTRLHLATKIVGEGVFAGGLRAPIYGVHIDRFQAQGVVVTSIPGGMMPGDLRGVDGVVGSDFLYHFLATIDYGHRALVLRPANDSAAFLAAANSARATAVPMWLVGDHMIFARARVNAAPDALYNIDTGGPGIGVDLTKSALAAAGITPDATHPQSMMGGGGATQFLPFTAASVTLGGLTERDLPGVYFPSGGMDGFFPFAIAGRISQEFFRHTAVTFDFVSMTLVVAPS